MQLTCVSCKKESSFDKYELDEAAQLTCPICKTQFALTATMKEPAGEPADKLGGPPEAGLDLGPSPLGGAGPATPPAPPPLAPESHPHVNSLVELINGGMGLEAAIDTFLGEEKKKETWKGDLALFNSKLQALSKDIGYEGDLGDLVSEMTKGDALAVKGENVELNLSKARVVLMRRVLGKNGGNVPMSGDLIGDRELTAALDDTPSPSGEGVDVAKALATYFG